MLGYICFEIIIQNNNKITKNITVMNNDAVLIENRALFIYFGSVLKFVTLVT